MKSNMLERFIEQWRRDRLENYLRMPADIREHAGIEETVLAGGYGYRQIVELVQNGADARKVGSEGSKGSVLHFAQETRTDPAYPQCSKRRSIRHGSCAVQDSR